MDQESPFKAKLKCKIAVPLLYKIVSTGKYPAIFEEKMEKSALLIAISLWNCSE